MVVGLIHKRISNPLYIFVMPYKDPQKQREYQKAHFQDNKEMWRNRQRQRRIENKAYLEEVKKAGCSKCGYDACPDALDFHHHKDDKEIVVSKSSRIHCLATLKKEVEKCMILCANCHRELHYHERINAGKLKVSPHPSKVNE